MPCRLKWKGFPGHIGGVGGCRERIGGPLAEVIAGDAEGVVFDGAGFGTGGILCAADPGAVLEGGWDDWGVLAGALREGMRRGGSGGLAGWFDYEGNFRFGIFPSWERRAVEWPEVQSGTMRAEFRAALGRDKWMARVRRAQDYIAAGDIYQVNLTHSLVAEWEGCEGAFHQRLRAASSAPYSCFLRLGDTVVASASPECFLSIDGRRIVTRPIKGTRPRCPLAADDEAQARELLTSEKERAELVMITDLERNDLGQVCEFGSVKVSDLCRLESFAQVHHMVSTVEGVLRTDVSPLDALRACFPGGSITGAPKKRAREVIAELETCPRGIYTGAIGFFDWSGRTVFNIAIRTLVVRAGVAVFGVGAGIVADSDPSAEYEETLHKAAGLFAALG